MHNVRLCASSYAKTSTKSEMPAQVRHVHILLTSLPDRSAGFQMYMVLRNIGVSEGFSFEIDHPQLRLMCDECKKSLAMSACKVLLVLMRTGDCMSTGLTVDVDSTANDSSIVTNSA
jgi:hypothetical protein